MIAGDNDVTRGATISVDLATQVTVSATYVRGVVTYAVTRGVDRGALLGAAGVHEADLAVDDARLPMDALIAVLRTGAAQSHDPAFALHCGDYVPCEQVSLASPLGQSATTVLGALQQVNRYARLGIDFPTLGAGDRFRIDVSAAGAWFIDLRPHDTWPEITELVFARIARGTARAAGRSVLRAVHVTHAAPAHGDAYRNVFRVPMVFGSTRNALLLDATFLNTPLTPAPAHVARILAAEADARLQAIDAQRTVRGRVELVLRPRLASADLGVERVASALAMSRRTLHRKLKTEGVTFETTLDELRRSVALERLQSGGVTVSEAAALVGFSDPAAFSRAFKRWTGERPSAAVRPTAPPSPAYRSRS
ncbi:AraC family transcriptional regulator [Gemmatimonas groenlandica]|nr:AraC family transcriptional regulator [Gemmatimonas groenlandica]